MGSYGVGVNVVFFFTICFFVDIRERVIVVYNLRYTFVGWFCIYGREVREFLDKGGLLYLER